MGKGVVHMRAARVAPSLKRPCLAQAIASIPALRCTGKQVKRRPNTVGSKLPGDKLTASSDDEEDEEVDLSIFTLSK
jgi:hypothetical protein